MFFARNEDYLQAIEVNDVYFFTMENGKVIAVLKNRRLQLSTSLFMVNELLGKRETFFRCHKSYIVNLSKIEKISRYNNKTYNIKFKEIKEQAYITEANLRILKERFISL
ncbi:MAG: LytTR family DNA-binding domain-containing protein [Ruminiclostridium sp.]